MHCNAPCNFFAFFVTSLCHHDFSSAHLCHPFTFENFVTCQYWEGPLWCHLSVLAGAATKRNRGRSSWLKYGMLWDPNKSNCTSISGFSLKLSEQVTKPDRSKAGGVGRTCFLIQLHSLRSSSAACLDYHACWESIQSTCYRCLSCHWKVISLAIMTHLMTGKWKGCIGNK